MLQRTRRYRSTTSSSITGRGDVWKNVQLMLLPWYFFFVGLVARPERRKIEEHLRV
jgi:hypothetical protein